jgi:PKD repeat protein
MSFKGVTSDLKGKRITDFFWDFGEGFKQGGQSINYSFGKRGEYAVKLGLLSEKDSLGVVGKSCVIKKIKIN